MTSTQPLVVRPDIAAAIEDGGPVVALESTLIAHGLPAPKNIETALAMEAAIRAAGAVPATIAVMGGAIRVGLTEAEITALAPGAGGAVRKASRRDLAIALASGETAATTVSATMIGAHLAGIALFATGGIGGVHRGAPFDVSADLTELGRTPVVVVCSGPKAILDLAATREMLETQGVPVIGYCTDRMPAGYLGDSAFTADMRVDSPAMAADIIEAQRSLGLTTGMLIGVPVPAADAPAPEAVDAAIGTAAGEAHAKGIVGNAVTPFMLERVAALTGAASLQANISLLINNARVAAEIAVALVGRVDAGAGRS